MRSGARILSACCLISLLSLVIWQHDTDSGLQICRENPAYRRTTDVPPSCPLINTASVVNSLWSMNTLRENTPGRGSSEDENPESLGGYHPPSGVATRWSLPTRWSLIRDQRLQTLEGYLDLGHAQHLSLTFNFEGQRKIHIEKDSCLVSGNLCLL